MRARIRFLGHPVHQMLIVFPLGLLATSVVFDLIGLATAADAAHTAAYWTLCAGIVGAVVAAPFGYLDWSAVPRGSRARRIGALHGAGNLVVSLLFVASWALRAPGQEPPLGALACAWGGAALALVTAWLGGELVCRLGVGVEEDAGPNRSQHARGAAAAPRSPR